MVVVVRAAVRVVGAGDEEAPVGGLVRRSVMVSVREMDSMVV